VDTRFTHFGNENTFSLLDPIFEATLLFGCFTAIIVIIKKVSIWCLFTFC